MLQCKNNVAIWNVSNYWKIGVLVGLHFIKKDYYYCLTIPNKYYEWCSAVVLPYTNKTRSRKLRRILQPCDGPPCFACNEAFARQKLIQILFRRTENDNNNYCATICNVDNFDEPVFCLEIIWKSASSIIQIILYFFGVFCLAIANNINVDTWHAISKFIWKCKGARTASPWAQALSIWHLNREILATGTWKTCKTSTRKI